MNANSGTEKTAVADAADQINEEPNPVDSDIVDAEWAGDDEMTAVEVSQEFLLGDLIKHVSRRFKGLAKPWSQLSESEQSTLMGYVATDARDAVKKAVRIIRSDNRLNFLAEVESVTFKDGVKSVLKTANTPESHALADKAGGIVMIVIDDGAAYLELGDSCQGEADQRPLFDASTEGTTVTEEWTQ